MDTAKYAHIVGVFRGRAKADQAVEAIKQAGMSDVELTVYDPQAAGVVDTPVDAGEASAMDTSVDTRCLSTVPSSARMKTALIALQKNRLIQLLLRASLEQRKHRVIRMISA